METPFVWTRKFNRILTRFCEEVPVKSHQMYFRSIPNSFSGRIAMDTMQRVLTELFPASRIQRQNAHKVLELLLKDGVIIGVQKVDQVKDEKDVFYRFGKQSPMDTYIKRPRRSVSVDQCKISQPRMSAISPDHFNSEPELCCTPSSSNTTTNSVMSSMENVSDKENKPSRAEVDAAALRFLRWISQDETISEHQRRKTIKAFKAHYPSIYNSFMNRKSPSISSAPQNTFGYKQQNSTDLDSKSMPLSPCSSHYSIQSARSTDELNKYSVVDNSSPKRNVRLSEAELNLQLTQKLNSVIQDPTYSERERQRILKYFKNIYPQIYAQRFNGERPLLKKIREFLPKITSEVR